MTHFLINGCRSIFTFACSSLAFTVLLMIVTLFGALTKNFPLGPFIINDLNILLIFAAVNIPLGFFLGSIAGKLRQRRIFFLSLLGFIFYWLLLVLIVLAFSQCGHALSLYSSIIGLSTKAMLAYSFYAVPLILIVVFVLERRTRK